MSIFTFYILRHSQTVDTKMAVTRGEGRSSSKPGTKSSRSGKSLSKSSLNSTVTSKARVAKSRGPKAPPPKQQKTKSSTGTIKRKRKVYTDKELGLPKLNMITPVGVQKPSGKKKGKVFVDDAVRLPPPESKASIVAL